MNALDINNEFIAVVRQLEAVNYEIGYLDGIRDTPGSEIIKRREEARTELTRIVRFIASITVKSEE